MYKIKSNIFFCHWISCCTSLHHHIVEAKWVGSKLQDWINESLFYDQQTSWQELNEDLDHIQAHKGLFYESEAKPPQLIL